MSFFQNLNFSSSNEDGDTEIAALTSANRIVCLTGSGTRPLDLLMTDAQDIIALDINPSQNALLALKLAALEGLERPQFFEFIGIEQSQIRLQLYARIRTRLDQNMQAYWDQKTGQIEAGLWYAGKWEKLLKWNAWFLKILRGKAITDLLQARDVEEQAQIWSQKFNDSKLQTAIEMIGRKWIWQWVMREPAGEFLPGPKAVGTRLASDFEKASRSFLFRESDFATLIFKGKLNAEHALPTHLRQENYGVIRERLDRIRIVEGGLTDLATLGVQEVDGFSLSDFGSYTDQEAYSACWNGIVSVAAHQALFCERIFMNDLALLHSRVIEHPDLSLQLTEQDKAIIYRIRAGTIAPEAQ